MSYENLQPILVQTNSVPRITSVGNCSSALAILGFLQQFKALCLHENKCHVLFLAFCPSSSLNLVNTARVAVCFYAITQLLCFSFHTDKILRLDDLVSKTPPRCTVLRLPWTLIIIWPFLDQETIEVQWPIQEPRMSFVPFKITVLFCGFIHSHKQERVFSIYRVGLQVWP